MLPLPLRTALVALAITLLACGTSTPPEPVAPNQPRVSAIDLQPTDGMPEVVAETYAAHAAELPAGKVLSYDLALDFGGEERFRGRVKQSPSMDLIAVTRAADSVTLAFDGREVAMVGDTSAEWARARFDVFTWPYFAAVGYKLADPGTQWEEPDTYPWADGGKRVGARLTFADGTGDSPDDYYLVVPGDDGLLDGMAYIVTLGKTNEEIAEAEPHAIRYSDYTEVDGVPVAQQWSFYAWDPDAGLGEALGSARVSDAEWVDRDAAQFATAGGKMVPAM